MRLEYFADVSLPRPVLLLYGEKGIDAGEVVLLRRAVQELADGAMGHRLQVEGFPGFLSVEGCSLIAEATDSNVGIELIAGSERSLSCRLAPAGWQLVCDLLEPFADHEQAASQNGFQYLDESGPIDWIISRSRSW
jgi:hypothetical protein